VFGPKKYTTIGRTASYGSWFNFYVCGLDITVKVPGGQEIPIETPRAPRERCGTA